MLGAISHPILATLGLPTPWQIATFAVAILSAVGAWWLIMRTDRIVHAVLPNLAWEHSLGWLNITAERRVNRALRWMGYGINILLFDSLVLILRSAWNFPPVRNWSDPYVIGELTGRASMMALCFIIWVLYLGCGLLPRARARRENAALEKYRAEIAAVERERELSQLPSRIRAAVVQPRADAQLPPTTPIRPRPRFNEPGG